MRRPTDPQRPPPTTTVRAHHPQRRSLQFRSSPCRAGKTGVVPPQAPNGCTLRWLSGLCFGIALATLAGSEPRAAGIMDNSFFVEEAYNQEPGIVQHITTVHHEVNRRPGSDDMAWYLAFTQEWPVPDQTHQFSFTLPYGFVRDQGRWTDGWGDLMIHYRYQIWFSQTHLTAMAPRASLILPTGDPSRGLGEDTLGAQFNLPFSTLVSDALFFHANAGLTALPNAASARDRDLIHYHVAASSIYAVTRSLHVMVEWVGLWQEGLDPSERRRHQWQTVVSPGLRYAINLPRQLQIVSGLAVPLGLNGAAPDYGLFFYLSVEHRLWSAR